MISLLVLMPVLVVVVVLHVVFRVLTIPFRLGRRRGFGYGRRRRFGGVGTVMGLFVLDRLFGGRRF